MPHARTASSMEDTQPDRAERLRTDGEARRDDEMRRKSPHRDVENDGELPQGHGPRLLGHRCSSSPALAIPKGIAVAVGDAQLVQCSA
jgi:hypothetical protein